MMPVFTKHSFTLYFLPFYLFTFLPLEVCHKLHYYLILLRSLGDGILAIEILLVVDADV